MESMNPKRIEGTPFPEELRDSGVSEDFRGEGKLNELDALPHKVIRTEKYSGLEEIYPKEIGMLELVQTTKKLYDELQEAYGILVPADFMIGKNEEGEEVVYSVVDKIEGKNLYSVENSKEIAVRVAHLYSTLAKYFSDKQVSGGLYLSDIHGPQQYVYGRKNGERENDIYLVDTDMFISDSPEHLYLVMKWLSESVIEEENHFETKFEDARSTILQFINKPLPGDFDSTERKNAERHISAIKNMMEKGTVDVVNPRVVGFE